MARSGDLPPQYVSRNRSTLAPLNSTDMLQWGLDVLLCGGLIEGISASARERVAASGFLTRRATVPDERSGFVRRLLAVPELVLNRGP